MKGEFGDPTSLNGGLMSDPISSQLGILTRSPSWAATPDNYSSLRTISLNADGTGHAIYAYGQTICAMINFRFAITAPAMMRFDYIETPQLQGRPTFVLTDLNRSKDIGFSLTEGEGIVREDVTGFVTRFRWTLTFAEPPYPEGLSFPHPAPSTFYGYRERIGDRNMVLP
jgi:hypothetical protein